MSAFDKIIGYETVKNELLKICDTFHNPHVYENLGAKTPRGLLLYGDVGLGKTLMAFLNPRCIISKNLLHKKNLQMLLKTTSFSTTRNDTN